MRMKSCQLLTRFFLAGVLLDKGLSHGSSHGLSHATWDRKSTDSKLRGWLGILDSRQPARNLIRGSG